MHFGTKSYLKSTRNHTAKHALNGNHQSKRIDDHEFHVCPQHQACH